MFNKIEFLNKNKKIYTIINFSSSIFIHFLIFVILNGMPHTFSPMDWKKLNVNVIKQNKVFSKKHNKTIRIENVVFIPQIKERKIKEDLKKTPVFNDKRIISKTESNERKEESISEKLISGKNIKKPAGKILPENLASNPIPRMERGIRSITEKSPLTSHLSKKIEDILNEPVPYKESEPVKKIDYVQKMVKDVTVKTTEKNKMHALSRINIKEQKKILLDKAQVAAIKKIEKITSITPELDKIIKEISNDQKVKLGSPLGTFENEIKDMEGAGPKITFAPRGEEKLTKVNEGIINEEIKESQKKVENSNIRIPDIVKEGGVKQRAIVEENTLKQRQGLESNYKKEIKHLKVAKPVDTHTAEESKVGKNFFDTQKKAIAKSQAKYGSPSGTFLNKIENYKGDAPPVEFAPKFYDKSKKDVKTEEEKIDIQEDTDKKAKVYSKKINQEIIEENNFLEEKAEIKISESKKQKEDKKISSVNKIVSPKQRIIASNNTKEQKQIKIKASSVLVNNNPLTTVQSSNFNIAAAADLQNKLEKLKKDLLVLEKQNINRKSDTILKEIKSKDDSKQLEKKEIEKIIEKIKKYDTTYELEIREEIETVKAGNELITKIQPVKQNNIEIKKKEESDKISKIERLIDRNPNFATKNKGTPLTVVNKGGAISRVISNSKIFSGSQMQTKIIKKDEKNIQEIPGAETNKQNLMSLANKIKTVSETKVSQKDINPELEEKKEKVKILKVDTSHISISPLLAEENKKSAEIKSEKASLVKLTVKSSFKKDISTDTKEIIKQEVKEKQPIKSVESFKKIDLPPVENVTQKIEKGNYPDIRFVTHNAVKILVNNDELEVSMQGDPGKVASFDIGLYVTKIPMIEVSPGAYRGTYRVIEGDKVTNAPVTGYLMNNENFRSSMVADRSVSIDTTPGITIASPSDVTVDKETQTISGIVDDPNIKSVEITVDEKIIVVPVEKGFFKADVKLREGKNTIEVKITDSEGNTKTDRAELTYIAYKEIFPKVAITYPSDGDVVDLRKTPMVKICGTVSDHRITRAELIGTEMLIAMPVVNGEFSHKVVPASEKSSFVVQVVNKDGKIGISEPVTIKTIGLSSYDAIISLNWDLSNADIDMLLKSPSGKSVSRKSRSYNIPGAKLEIYNKTEYGGQEVITLSQASAGLYTILVNNFASNKAVITSVDITFKDPKDSKKINTKVFGPKSIRAGEEWEILFTCIPEEVE